MHFAYLDASALVKRYTVELGTPVVDHLFRRVPLDRMIVLAVGMTEVISILVRKHNGGHLAPTTFRQAVSEFRNEISTQSPVRILTIIGDDAEAAYDYVERHSINSTDAILLASALALAPQLRARGDDLLLVTSDRRLLRTARAEGLTAFDPEQQSVADLDVILGP